MRKKNVTGNVDLCKYHEYVGPKNVFFHIKSL